MSLEYAAMWWLWVEQNCHFIVEERCPRYAMGEPDVLGVTKGRYLTEIEIKRSASDFYADSKKNHRINQITNTQLRPRQFYYLMPPELAEKLNDKIPEHAGLSTLDERGYLKVLKRAPVNKDAPKLSSKECIKMARCMTSHMMGYAIVKRTLGNRLQDFDYTMWVQHDKGTYQI